MTNTEPGVLLVAQSSIFAPCMCRNEVTVPMMPALSEQVTVRMPFFKE